MTSSRRRVLVALSASVPIALSGCLSHVPPAIEGEVIQKVVQGVRDETTYSVVVAWPDRLHVKEEVAEGLFEDEHDLILDDDRYRELGAHYEELDYLVAVELTTRDRHDGEEPDGSAPQYFVSREEFNGVGPNDAVRGRVSLAERRRLIRLEPR